MLLIITSDTDLTADYLISELIECKLPYFRVNSEELSGADFSFSVENNMIERLLTLGPRSVDLSKIKSVWYRRAVQPQPTATLSHSHQAFVSGELRHLALGLMLNPDAVWVNPIDKVAIAEHKLFQLQIARKVGFRVPRTLVSKNLDRLQSFCNSNSQGTICKPIYHGMFVDGISRHSIYTRRVTTTELDQVSVSVCPVMLQEEIRRRADVRVTIVGTKCFVADIVGDSTLVDWRNPENSIEYSRSKIDAATQTACREMLGELGLLYGAFDFIRTPDGNLVFLEINPTGEWAWLEETLKFPIRQAFIELFFGRNT